MVTKSVKQSKHGILDTPTTSVAWPCSTRWGVWSTTWFLTDRDGGGNRVWAWYASLDSLACHCSRRQQGTARVLDSPGYLPPSKDIVTMRVAYVVAKGVEIAVRELQCLRSSVVVDSQGKWKVFGDNGSYLTWTSNTLFEGKSTRHFPGSARKNVDNKGRMCKTYTK